MSVYFIRRGEDGPVKIGFAKVPASRIRDIQTYVPEQLIIVRIISDGDRTTEKLLHFHYRHLLLRGEWFRYDETMLIIDPNVDIDRSAIFSKPINRSSEPVSKFRAWRLGHNLTQAEAARVLGYSIRQLKVYDQGEKEPNRILALAMAAINHGMTPYGQPPDLTAAPETKPARAA
jgi:hypothetical protein